MKSFGLYHLGRWFVRLAVGLYFNRIEFFHRDRVPLEGPVLFASNHPNSLSDAFLVSVAVPRKVHFVATVQLFRLRVIKWFLLQCGVIPINRVKDDARAMRSVLDTFEACHEVLERGEAIGIFPEGITHDDPQLKPIKTGTARMALDLEQRHAGKLGLKIVPVGLNFSDKETYRSDVLVNFGEPILVSEFLPADPARRKESIQRLSGRLEEQIQSLILHLPRLEQMRLITAVKRLYFEELRLGNRVVSGPISPAAEELLLTQAIQDAVEFAGENHAPEVALFSRQLDRYEQLQRKLRLSDQDLDAVQGSAARSWLYGFAAVLGAPIALFGWIHRLVPALVVRWAVARFAKTDQHRAQVSTAAILAGIVSFGLFYGLLLGWVYLRLGFDASLWLGLSLPVTGLVAHHYWKGLRQLAAGVHNTMVFLRAPLARRRLIAMRGALRGEIEAMRIRYLERAPNRLGESPMGRP